MTAVTDSQEFARRFCPHRGIGPDNTIPSLEAAIAANPFMVEFDTKLQDGLLHLGHPPHINTAVVLQDVLGLFESTRTLPKVDIKLSQVDSAKSMRTLVDVLASWSLPVLVNVGGDPGDLTGQQFMAAEAALLQETSDTVRLNIDVARYTGASDAEISLHLRSLVRAPFSVSPQLGTPDVTQFALDHGIGHMHFWASHNSQFAPDVLDRIMRDVLDSGLQVYFDIQQHNIGPATA